MKKIAIALALTVGLTGCASGPQHGYYDKQTGEYVPSEQAQNADRAETFGWVAVGAAALAGLGVAIHAATK